MSNLELVNYIEDPIRRHLHDFDRLGVILDEFVRGPGLQRALDQLLHECLTPQFRKIEDVGRDAILLMRRPDFVLHLRMVRGSGELHTVGADAVAVVRGRGPVTLDRYAIAEPFDASVFVPNAPLRLTASSVVDGPVHERLAEPVVYDYRADQPFAIVRISRQPSADQVWFFDRANLTAKFPALGYSELSGYVQFARTMSALGETRALAMLEQLAGHGSHVVRWAAIQAIGKLDGARGVALLRDATLDRHPHIRRGAAKALEQLEANYHEDLR